MATAKGSPARQGGSTASARVRASRDGDRFHYTWAADRLLGLLSPATQLQQITVEGLGSDPSDEEPDGAEAIDLAEFYGDLEGEFTCLVVRQFKYSTLHPNANFTLGETREVLEKFAQLDPALRAKYSQASVRFSIVTNKPIASEVRTAVHVLATGEPAVPGSAADRLTKGIPLGGDELPELCDRLALEDHQPGVTALRCELDQEIGGLTADTKLRVSARLVDRVASRASTESHGPIVKADVLAAFGCSEDELAPAPSMLDDADFIARDAYKDLANQILKAAGSTVDTAEGGGGKSTFARALRPLLSDRAEVVIYDCFGQGTYRSPARPRHRHRDGLVQLANEITGLGLCLPIIHAGNVAPEEYTKAFVRRLKQASETNNDEGI